MPDACAMTPHLLLFILIYRCFFWFFNVTVIITADISTGCIVVTVVIACCLVVTDVIACRFIVTGFYIFLVGLFTFFFCGVSSGVTRVVSITIFVPFLITGVWNNIGIANSNKTHLYNSA